MKARDERDPREIELDEEAELRARRARLASGCREAARRAIAFARRYREEEGEPGGARELACVEQAFAWRLAAREAMAGRSFALPARPGLARAFPVARTTAAKKTRRKRQAAG